jgi:iron complex transport system ATP-binding protein
MSDSSHTLPPAPHPAPAPAPGPQSAPAAPPPALAYDRADVGYRAERIVRAASLEVAAGEIVGLVGPNGAGKSTLLRAVTGDADLLAGALTLSGTDSRSLAPLERARLVGVVPQQVTAAFSVPAREFVAMGRHPHLTRFAAPSAADDAVVERAMRLTDTLRLAEKPTDALSGGDLQRLALAQALAQEPSVLLLDEPVSHLDLNHRLQVLDLTRDLADAGMAVLAVFHDLDLAARYADRIAIVADGRLGAVGTPAEVLTTAMLRETFGVRAVVGIDVVTGCVQITPVLREEAVAGEPRGRVLVIGGSGVAAPLMRRLVLAGWHVSAGALNTGDADQLVAHALGVEHIELPPFAPMDALATARVRELAADAQAIVVSEVPFGHGNVANLRAAVESERPLVLVGQIEGRDFTGGAAAQAWERALEQGATTVPRLDAADCALAALVPQPDTH